MRPFNASHRAEYGRYVMPMNIASEKGIDAMYVYRHPPARVE
jgi:hypothetical protein